MPQLPYSIELHDSDLEQVWTQDGAVHLLFAPAYIHRNGKGWTQEVEVIIRNASMETDNDTWPVTVDDGHMRTELGPYHNLLEVPFAVEGLVELELEFMSGATLIIKGNGIEHEFKGEPVFVEEYKSM